jgi:pimeloyl-ACP methyl ester carboxylesterase
MIDPPAFTHAADGAVLAYRRRGDGPTMLIHNGLLSTELHWRPWIAHYRRGLTVVTWDYRGHGASPRPRDPRRTSIAGHAADGHAVLSSVGVARPAIVCGLSMGVQTALEHYRLHPEDVRALVLICGIYGHPLRRYSSSPTLRRATVAAAHLAGRGGRLLKAALWPITHTRLGHEMAFRSGAAIRDECPRSVLDELYQHVGSLDADVTTAAVAAYLDHSAEEVLETIRVPTLIIAGGADELAPLSIAEEMHRRIAGSSLHVVQGHAHLAQVERPDEVHAVVDAFLARLLDARAVAS